jgi:hypothetical protein
VAAASDVIAQSLTSPSVAVPRTLKFALFGLCWSGPALHYCAYPLLRACVESVCADLFSACAGQGVVERLFAAYPAGASTTLRKVLLDQLTFGPASNIAFMTFFALAVAPATAAGGAPAGTSTPSLARRVASDLPRVQLLAWRFWPAVALLNYRAVPPPLRPLAANVAGLLWSTFLAVSARRRALPATPRKAIKAA